MSGRRRAAVTGLGAVSGFGEGAERLWRALLDGERAVREVPSLVLAGLPSTAAVVPGADPLASGDRATAMALVAAAEAVADGGGAAALVDGDRLAVTVGTTLGGIGGWLDVAGGRAAAATGWTWSGPAEAIAAAHGARAAVRSLSIACASGNAALGAALDEIRAGRADQVLAGGVDALNDFVVAGFASLRALDPGPCRPFDRGRIGLNLGEGACFLLVEEEGHARARGAPIRAFLDGYGSAADAHHMTGPDPDGLGCAAAITAALADARLAPGAIDFVSAHGTATVFNDLMEAKALHRALGERAPRIPVHSIKGALGHTLGAAGAFEALACVRALQTACLPPTAGLVDQDPAIALDVIAGEARVTPIHTALSTSSGFGGLNACIVLRAQ